MWSYVVISTIPAHTLTQSENVSVRRGESVSVGACVRV